MFARLYATSNVKDEIKGLQIGGNMEKRRFERLDVESSLLGFGCMRFPMNEDGNIG